MAVCTTCNEEKPISEFVKKSSNKSGYRSTCKPCMADKSKKYRENNLEVERERQRIKWRRYSAENKDKIRAKTVRQQRARREAVVEVVERQLVFKRDGGVCHICNEAVDPSDWHLDHIHPVSKGGNHTYDNVAVSHPFCNTSKGDR